MLKLYGFSVSNYYNMVKLALLEKGLPFEEVPFYGGTSPEALAISPRGKVPVLGVEQGFINETAVILEYIEQSQKGTPLLPSDPFERAQVLALAKEIELYIELPARMCYGEAFFGMQVPEAIKERTKAELLLGFASLAPARQVRPLCGGRQPEHCRFVFPVQRAIGLCGGAEAVWPGFVGRDAGGQGAAGASGAESECAADCGGQGSGDASVYGDDRVQEVEFCSVLKSVIASKPAPTGS